MSVLDFLFEGSAPTPGSGSATTTSQLPEWYNEYTKNMLGRAQAIADIPYSTYGGPRIAGFTPTEQTGMAATQKAAGTFEPFLEGAKTALGQAGGVSGLSAAAPYLQAAGTTFPGAVSQYMSPYTQNVVNRIADVGVRQLQEKFLPAIGEEFTKAGQFGGSRMGEFGARALRDVQEAVLSEQAKALESGYRTAADIYGADVARQAQLAGVAGQLGRAQQEALLTAGSQLGQLSQADLNRLLQSGVQLSDIARSTGQLTAEDASRLATLAGTAGTLGTAQQRTLADIGTQLADIQGKDLTRALAGAGQLGELGLGLGKLGTSEQQILADLATRYGGLGESAQTLGLRGAEAITGVGAAERGMQQQNLNLAYQDFLRQQGYPAEQAKFLSGMLQGVRLPEVRVEQKQTLPADWEYGTTGAGKLIGGIQDLKDLYDLIKKFR